MGVTFSQFLPPNPTFTEENIPPLIGKVFIVTGGNSGVGLEIVKILYSKGGTVYIAGRSGDKIAAEIETVKSVSPDSIGILKSLIVNFSDLGTVPTCASSFLAQESRLDVLFNNAGVSRRPAGSTSAQGHELHMATNCLGPFLFTKLLLPILIRTAKSSPQASVRVVFASSGIITPPALTVASSCPSLSPETFLKISIEIIMPRRPEAGVWHLSSTRGSGKMGSYVCHNHREPSKRKVEMQSRGPSGP